MEGIWIRTYKLLEKPSSLRNSREEGTSFLIKAIKVTGKLQVWKLYIQVRNLIGSECKVYDVESPPWSRGLCIWTLGWCHMLWWMLLSKDCEAQWQQWRRTIHRTFGPEQVFARYDASVFDETFLCTERRASWNFSTICYGSLSLNSQWQIEILKKAQL